jgi:L-asparaginase
MPVVELIHTGGTLGMSRGDDGIFRPHEGNLASLLARMPEFEHPSLPTYRLTEFSELLDSSNMTPGDWLRIAHHVASVAQDCDGFVVIHGTDTMAYTASALSFMLEGLDRPVVVTGSQIPLAEPRNDARENLLTALELAATSQVPEVCLYFNGQLLRGNRATKTDSTGFIAFESPQVAPLGRVGVAIEITRALVRPPGVGGLRVQKVGDAHVAAFRVFPGMRPEALAAVLAPPTQGLVLECYGTGTAPGRDPRVLEVLAEATARGVVVVAVTQCARGSVELHRYEMGHQLALAGVVSGYDMTPEAALTKLFYLLGKPGLGPDGVRRLLATDLRGELSLP